jgi:Cu-Zn family superoxide dismutase
MPLPGERSILQAFVVALLSIGCTSAVTRHPVAAAHVALTDVNGAAVGTAQLWQEAGGLVHVNATVASLTPGPHGIHFHAVGRCEGSTQFNTAGAHYNPLNRDHGLTHPSGPHAGDAPNIVAGDDGRGNLSFTTDRVTLTSGGTTLFDADGTALIIHAAADDQVTQPAGNSGARVACGVVQSVR